MAVPEIIGGSRSTYTWAVRMVCEMKGIDYVLKEMSLRSPAAFTEQWVSLVNTVSDRTFVRTYFYLHRVQDSAELRAYRAAIGAADKVLTIGCLCVMAVLASAHGLLDRAHLARSCS
ncbi:MAG: hypothetical protein ISP49_09705 [Reyranella sp.]|nr:hypothetical protein [Reyranella sp.]